MRGSDDYEDINGVDINVDMPDIDIDSDYDEDDDNVGYDEDYYYDDGVGDGDNAAYISDNIGSSAGQTLTEIRPTPRQREFMLADNRYICYGGARGGGKSQALRTKAKLLALAYPGIKMLLIRRTYPELAENHIERLKLETLGLAKYRDTDKVFMFANGSRLKCGYCHSESDVLQYQGQEYDIVFLDEATQLSEMQFLWLDSIVRGVNTYPKRMYLTCNPGGVGHEWVKRLFVDRGRDTKKDSVFIRATIHDNAPLIKAQPEYLTFLESIPDDNLRRAWLDGDWDVFAGQFFSEFSQAIHVIDPITIPSWWRRYFAMDYGLDMCACVWVAVDDDGNEYVYRELHRSNMIASEAAQKIVELSKDDKIEAYYAPPDLWARSSDYGVSTVERFAENGLYVAKASNSRVAGWQSIKEHIKPIQRILDDGTVDTKSPYTSQLRVFKSCHNLIRCLPLLQYSARDPCDADTEPHDITHICDALRYYCASRVVPAQKPEEKTWTQKAREKAIRKAIRQAHYR